MSGAERLTASEAAARLEAGSLTAETLVRDCLDRAEARASVKAWVWLDQELALAQARAADRAGRPGLLKGVPVGVKDVIDTYDMPTQHGSPIYRGNRPFADAACVALTRAAGGVILGKTVTTEFANRHPRETVHPHNPSHTPGGSSSGSAAAVADFQVPVGFGDADRRFDDPPGRILRGRRLQAELWRVQPGRHQNAVPQPRHAWASSAAASMTLR